MVYVYLYLRVKIVLPSELCYLSKIRSLTFRRRLSELSNKTSKTTSSLHCRIAVLSVSTKTRNDLEPPKTRTTYNHHQNTIMNHFRDNFVKFLLAPWATSMINAHRKRCPLFHGESYSK